MKRKRAKPINWDAVAWTRFEPATVPPSELTQALGDLPAATYLNSRYQVSIYFHVHDEPWGPLAHLSIKTLDKSARHDWRDLQRIKNELCGEEYDAVEVYPAEDKLVDCANQYHLFVFRELRLPFGFQSRLVSDGDWGKSKQRPFEARPADCVSASEFDAILQRTLEHKKALTGS